MKDPASCKLSTAYQFDARYATPLFSYSTLTRRAAQERPYTVKAGGTGASEDIFVKNGNGNSESRQGVRSITISISVPEMANSGKDHRHA
jgi:hypothetical protein